MDIICNCGKPVEDGRAEVGMTTCRRCAFSRPDVSRVRGNMVYGHKTGAVIEIMSNESYISNKRYFKPNGARSAVKNFSKNICR